jgi:hypothetical protein
LINVAIAEKFAQMRTAEWFADRIAAANPKGRSAINPQLESQWL